MTLIEARGVTVDLGGRRVLEDMDFAIGRGEIVTIVGPNGSGKSTFLRALIGAVAPTGGTVSRVRGLAIGYVPQRLHIDSTLPLTVARFLNLPRRRGADAIAAGLAQVGLSGLEQRAMTELSGGQFQRALLARALLGSPDILVLDEPTQGLDQPATAGFYRQIAEAREASGCAVLMVSHDLHVVMSASDRVVCINGHICCQGSPTVVSAAPEYRALFGLGTGGAFALYRHDHDHEHGDGDGHDHGPDQRHAAARAEGRRAAP